MPNTPFRTDQVGSFLRPPGLLEARAKWQAGEITEETLRALEDEVVLDLLQMQRDVGVEIFGDGEVRRIAWHTGFIQAADGLQQVAGAAVPYWHEKDGTVVATEPVRTAAVDKLSLRRRFTGIESAFLQAHAPGPYKITLPSPIVLSAFLFSPGGSEVYRTREELLDDIKEMVKQELRALVDEGTPYIQMDEGFTAMVNENWASMVRKSGGDPDKEIAAAVRLENECYDLIPRDNITVGMHICRGNSQSRWAVSGGYEGIAEQVFADLNVDRFLLEYDSERAGDFAPLRFLGKGKIAVLGLVTTKFPEMESEDDLMRRIEEAAQYAPIEQLALSPQCGFASVMEGNKITPDVQRQKLELVARVAERVWGS